MIATRIRQALPPAGLAVLISLASAASLFSPFGLRVMAAEPLPCKGNYDAATPSVVEFAAGSGGCVIRDGSHRLTGGGDLSFAIRPGAKGRKAVLEAALGTGGGRRTGGFQICLLGDGPSGANCRREFAASPGMVKAIVESAAHRMILDLRIAADGAIGVSNAMLCRGTGPDACD